MAFQTKAKKALRELLRPKFQGCFQFFILNRNFLLLMEKSPEVFIFQVYKKSHNGSNIDH